MFRPLMLAIFRLYMNLSSSYTACVGCFWGVGKGLVLAKKTPHTLVDYNVP